MSTLSVFVEAAPAVAVAKTDQHAEIARALKEIGVRFEQWTAGVVLSPGSAQETVLAAYRADVARLQSEGGYQACDVVSVAPDNPQREAIRKKFFAEHAHSEDEVRFFVEGRGAFYLHVGARVYAVVCEKGDLISVPAGTRHWFDTGVAPSFTAIRLFTDVKGWEAAYTQSDLATQVPTLEQL